MLLNRFARHGYQVGVIGSQFSQNDKFGNQIFTAVVLEEDTSVSEALASGSTLRFRRFKNYTFK